MAENYRYNVPDPRVIESNSEGYVGSVPSDNQANQNPTAIVPQDSKTIGDSVGTILDRTWARQAFLMADSHLDDTYDIANRYWSSASAKFTDTRIGGNIGVNARPQFTRYSDIRVKGRIKERHDVTVDNVGGQYGMGRYYSEAIDDNAQIIYMRFGVPQFNSLGNFLVNAFSSPMGTYVKTGRAKSNWYKVGEAIGTISVVSAFPVLSAGIFAGRLLGSFFSRPTSKFYTLKPTMNQYWLAVNTLVNTIAINRGILPRIMTPESEDRKAQLGKPFGFDKEMLDQLASMMPDVFTQDFGIDIFATALKAQRMANQLYLNDFEALNASSAADFTGYLRKEGQEVGGTYIYDKNSHPNLIAFLSKVSMIEYYLQPDNEDKNNKLDSSPKIDPVTGKFRGQPDGSDSVPQEGGYFKKMAEYFDAELNQGGMFACFRVDATGAISESFSSSAVESDLQQKINSTSSTARETAFTFANGNIGDNLVANTVESVVGAVTDFVSGSLNAVTLGMSSALDVLAGSGYIDIPKHWQSSSANLPRANYTVKLISPYGNAISQLQNLYIPLSMLLAAALPRSTGKQSYTSPFLVQLYDRGRCQIQLGIVDSLSITRGTSNLSFTAQGRPLAIDVSFSIMDLSSIMHMPISTGTLFGTDVTMDEDNILMDYLAVLAGQDIYSQFYPMPKAKLNFAKRITSFNRVTSPAYGAMLFHESATSGLLSYLTLGSVNVLEGFGRGASIVPSGP